MAELEQIVDTSSGGTNTTNQIHERRRLLSEDGSELLGYPVRVSTQLTDGQVIFGNFADLVIAQWGGMKIDTTNAVNFASAQQHIRALSFFDIGIRHPQSFCRPS
jgi:HK97 family phage major capsid protein